MIEIYDRTDLEVIKQYEDFISNGEKDKASQLRATFVLTKLPEVPFLKNLRF